MTTGNFQSAFRCIGKSRHLHLDLKFKHREEKKPGETFGEIFIPIYETENAIKYYKRTLFLPGSGLSGAVE